jgi:hypothetical protein
MVTSHHLKLLIIATASTPAAAATSGSTLLSAACSLAGYERDAGGCTCLEGWTGARCAQLDLEPAASLQEIQAWAPAGRASWGGTVVSDPTGAGFHLFAAVMADNLSLAAGWETHSTVEHLVSASSPAGPFAPCGTSNPVKNAEAHNPSIAYDAKNQQWCLYYIGRSPIDGPPVTPAYPSGIADIAVTCSDSLDGPWQGAGARNGPFPLVPHQIYPPRWDNWIQNPEPVFHADGSVTLIMNSNQ